MEHADSLSVVLITHDVTDAYRLQLTRADLSTALIENSREVGEAFGVTSTPSAVVVGADGLVGSTLAEGAIAITDLLARAVSIPLAMGNKPSLPARDGEPPPSTAAGTAEPAPSFRFPDLDGNLVDTATLRGRAHLVVFWNPDCGYCGRMLPELRELDRGRPEIAAALVLVSAGTVERNREIGLRAPVLLDQGFAMGSRLGLRGTPSAVLFDRNGLPLAPPAVGAPQILALAAASTSESAATRPLAIGS